MEKQEAELFAKTKLSDYKGKLVSINSVDYEINHLVAETENVKESRSNPFVKWTVIAVLLRQGTSETKRISIEKINDILGI